MLGGWTVASGVIAAHGGYRGQLGDGVPWLPVAVVGVLAVLLLLGRTAPVAAAVAGRGMVGSLLVPHAFRVAGVVFVLALALGRFASRAAGRLAGPVGGGRAPARRGGGRRSALWVNGFGTADGRRAHPRWGGLTGFGLRAGRDAGGQPLGEQPLALIPTADVPLLLARTSSRSGRIAGATGPAGRAKALRRPRRRRGGDRGWDSSHRCSTSASSRGGAGVSGSGRGASGRS